MTKVGSNRLFLSLENLNKTIVNDIQNRKIDKDTDITEEA